MKIIKILLIVLFLSDLKSALALTNSSIAAIVNNEPITVIALNNRLHAMIRLNNIDQNQIDLKKMKKQVLHMLIDEKLMSEMASKQNISIGEAELNESLRGFAAQNSLSKEELLNILESKKINKKELIDILKAQIIFSKIAKEEFMEKVKVSEAEIKEQFEIMRKYQKNNNDAKLKLAEIAIVGADQNQNKIYANNIIEAIKAGADFQKLVQEFSSSPSSKENNGEIGWVQLSQLSPQVIEILKNLKAGEISKPIEQENAVMIFKVLDRQDILAKKLGTIPTAEEKKEIADFLKMKKINSKAKFYLTELKRNAFIEIKNFSDIQ